jgi:hypothetical protein
MPMENSAAALDLIEVELQAQPASKTSIVVTNAEIEQWDPLIKKLINTQILRYWASGNTIHTLDWEATIGRLGMSIWDLIQIGRIYVLHQVRYLKEHHDPNREGSATHQTLMYQFLSNKFQSLCRVQTNAKHGGGVVAMDEHRLRLQAFVDAVTANPEMSIEECLKQLQATFAAINIQVQRLVRAGLFNAHGTKLRAKFQTPTDIARHIEKKMSRLEVVRHVSLEARYSDDGNDAGGQLIYEPVDDMTPETYLLVKQFMENEMENNENNPASSTTVSATPAVKRRNTRTSNRLIFKLAKEKGLPVQQGALANHLGKSPSAFSNILRGDVSNGDKAFQAKVKEIFGLTIQELRQPVEAETVADKGTV